MCKAERVHSANICLAKGWHACAHRLSAARRTALPGLPEQLHLGRRHCTRRPALTLRYPALSALSSGPRLPTLARELRADRVVDAGARVDAWVRPSLEAFARLLIRVEKQPADEAHLDVLEVFAAVWQQQRPQSQRCPPGGEGWVA